MYFALAITGPTASGKTALSLKLAEALSLEIVSLDSMQIYKGMDIGTAKATREERQRVQHHLIDIVEPNTPFSAEDYKAYALEVVREINGRGSVPLFVGGTGLYLDTLLRNSTEAPKSDPVWFEERLLKIKSEEDKELLWHKLNSCDPISAEKIHKNNVRRVLRALEIYEKTGKTKSYFDGQSRSGAPEIKIGHITLDVYNRDLLYSRIDKRVDEMIKDGLVSEVKRLVDCGYLGEETTAAQAIGYKEMLAYIRGESTEEEAVELIKLASRRYAKRQLTWFRAKEAERVYLDTPEGKRRDFEEIFAEIRRIAARFINENISCY